jgi:filamentous hemagglutinin
LADRSVHVINGGSKGAWNKALNKPLEKNADYLVNGYTYKTDNLGRIKSVEGELILSKADRAKYQQNKVGKSGNAGDEGGHLIASIFNGPGEKLNLVPMNGNFNKGAFRDMERMLADAVTAGKKVEVKIEIQYGSSGGRPDGFLARYIIDGGREVIKAFKNNPGGI